MSVVVAAVAGGAALTGVGMIMSANAASDAAESQGNIAKDQLAQAKKAEAFSVPTMGEIDNMYKQIGLFTEASSQSKSQLQYLQKQITETYGDNIIGLGKQLYDQISGQDSGVVKSASDSIARKRSQLEQSLIAKMGPGALTSTAGAQALNNFDMQSDQYLSNLRQDSVGQIIKNIGGLQGGQSQSVSDATRINQNLSGLLGQIQKTQDVFQQRQTNAALGVVSYAGAEHVQGLQEAKGRQATGTQLAEFGTKIATSGIGGAASGAAKAKNTTFSAGDLELPDPVGSELGSSMSDNLPSADDLPDPATAASPFKASDLSAGRGFTFGSGGSYI